VTSAPLRGPGTEATSAPYRERYERVIAMNRARADREQTVIDALAQLLAGLSGLEADGLAVVEDGRASLAVADAYVVILSIANMANTDPGVVRGLRTHRRLGGPARRNRRRLLRRLRSRRRVDLRLRALPGSRPAQSPLLRGIASNAGTSSEHCRQAGTRRLWLARRSSVPRCLMGRGLTADKSHCEDRIGWDLWHLRDRWTASRTQEAEEFVQWTWFFVFSRAPSLSRHDLDLQGDQNATAGVLDRR